MELTTVKTVSDTLQQAAGQKEDKAGKAIISKLEQYNVTIGDYIIIPDEKSEIQGKVLRIEAA